MPCSGAHQGNPLPPAVVVPEMLGMSGVDAHATADVSTYDAQTLVEWPSFLDPCHEAAAAQDALCAVANQGAPETLADTLACRRTGSLWQAEPPAPVAGPDVPHSVIHAYSPALHFTGSAPRRVDGSLYVPNAPHLSQLRPPVVCDHLGNAALLLHDSVLGQSPRYTAEASAHPSASRTHADAVYNELSSILTSPTATPRAPAPALTSRRARNVTASPSATSSAAGRSPSSPELSARKPSDGKQRRHYRHARSSKYCHLCARHERIVEMVSCGNLGAGLCQKSVCRKCFASYNLDWEAARACALRLWQSRESCATVANPGPSDGERGGDYIPPNELWLCPHCQNACPARAKCYAYNRQTVQRRVRTQQARMQDGSETTMGL
jgi:hypothetical protein